MNATEKAALLSIRDTWKYNITGGLNWTESTDPCLNNWFGISCDASGAHILRLNMSTLGVNGVMPEAIRNLSFLEHLDITTSPNRGSNYSVITGDLAPLASLTSLKSLNVSRSLRGGLFPEVIYNLTTLTELRIDNCEFNPSPMSPKFGQLKNLQILYLASNNFMGSIPAEIWTLRNLLELSFGPNDITSNIPPEIGNLTNLQMFNVHDCNIWGGIPSEIGRLTRMTNLRLYNNMITGRIPDSMRNMTQLSILRLSQNYLSGEIPSWVWTLRNATDVRFDKNSLTGPYHANLSGMPLLQEL